MDIFDPGNELIREQQNGLQGKFAVAKIEQILQARSEEIKNHGVVITFRAKPADKRDADSSGQGLVDACLIFKLGMLCLDALQFDSNLFTGNDVRT